MPETWVALLAVAGVIAAGFYFLSPRRRKSEPLSFADPREEQLTRRLAGSVGCSLAEALPSVRREIEFGSGQSDETLLKRAIYHYRRDLPEPACGAYRDSAPG